MPTQSKFTKYFKLLGLPKTAAESDIRDAYKKLARSYHPDKVSQEEAAEANGYMAELNEAHDILIKECMPIRSALKRRHSSLVDANDFQQPQSIPNCSGYDGPPRKKSRQSSSTPEELPKPQFANTNHQTPGKQPFSGIDVEQIRIQFSEMNKIRLIEYCQQIGLSQSDLELRHKDSKADSIVFATSQKVRSLLLEHHCPLSDLEYHTEQLCQTDLTTKWAHNSKTACRRELIDVHGYDHIRLSKWTHWQLINELVKASTQSSVIKAESATPTIKQNVAHPTTTLPSSPLKPIEFKLYHPQTHPELLHHPNYALPHPSKSATTLHHEQSTLTLSHLTNLTLSSSSHLLTLQNNNLQAALAHHTHLQLQLTSTNSTTHLNLTYLQPDQQLIMRLSRETGLTAQAAGLGLEALGYDHEAVRKRFDEEGGAEEMNPAFLVPSVKMIGWVDKEKTFEDQVLMEE